MKLRKFCSKCGRLFEEKEKIYPDFLCKECYGDVDLDLELPQKIQIRRCTECGAISLRIDDKFMKWQYIPEDETQIDFLSRLLYENLIFRLEEKNNLQCNLFISQDTELDQEKDISFQLECYKNPNIPPETLDFLIKLRDISCIHCAKKSGGRFDAIVQIRIQHPRDERRLPEILQEIRAIEEEENHKNLAFFISKVDETTNGFDLLVSNNAMGRALMNKLRSRFPFEIKHSRRLMGLDSENGQKMYRQSTLLRLVPVERGDKILFDGQRYHVKNITHHKVILEKLPDKKVKQINFDQFQKKKWVFVEEENPDDESTEDNPSQN